MESDIGLSANHVVEADPPIHPSFKFESNIRVRVHFSSSRHDICIDSNKHAMRTHRGQAAARPSGCSLRNHVCIVVSNKQAMFTTGEPPSRRRPAPRPWR